MTEETRPQKYKLDGWIVDVDSLTVMRGGKTQRVRPKDLAVLGELARNAPAVVARPALIDSVWPRGFVDPAVLNNAISRLRGILEPDGRTVIETIPRQGYRIVSPTTTIDSDRQLRWTEGSPYRGLQPFSSTHTSVFFGRGREITAVLAALQCRAELGRSFLLLLGASGTGKTSLINAGIVPALRDISDNVLAANWQISNFVVSPESTLWDTLAALMNDAISAHGAERAVLLIRAYDLEHTLESTLELFVDVLSKAATDKPARLLLIFDHLEQLVGDRLAAATTVAFFDAVHQMARTGHIWIIAALRSDFYEEYNRIPALTALKQDGGQFDVIAPDAEQMGAIIREPAKAAGVDFETDAETGLSLDDVLQARAIEHTDVLPMLQFTLHELYDSRDSHGVLTFGAYRKMGGLEGSMAQCAEQIYESLDEAARDCLTVILSAMVRVSGRNDTRHSRRHAVIQDLITTPARKRLFDRFVAGRLFVTGLAGDVATVSVAHEALFVHWERARAVLAKNYRLLVTSKQLTDAVTTWEEHSRSDNYLLSTGPLEECERLVGSNAIELSTADYALVNASRQRVKKSDSLRRVAIAALAVLAVVATGAATIALVERREASLEALRATQTTEFLVRLFELADPGQRAATELTAKQVLDRGAQQLSGQLDQQPQVRSALLQTIGSVYMNLGLYDEAAPLLDESLQLRQTNKATTNDVVDSLNTLGKLHYYRGDYDISADFYRRAVSNLEQGRQLNTALHATTLNHQGESAATFGNYEEAIELHRRALSIRRKLFGENDAATGTSIQNLAGAQRRNGALDEAELLYRQALSIHESVYGPDHPEVAVALSNLGLLMTDLERYPEAEPLLERALLIRRNVLGNRHPHTGNSLHNLSALFFKQGNYERAEPVFEESLALHIELFGEDHDAVAYGRNNLATLLLKTDRPVEAQDMYRKSLQSLRKRLGDEHPNTALIQGNFARAALANGAMDIALENAAAAVRVLEEALPADHWRLAVIRGVHGAALMSKEHYRDAETELTASWNVLRDSHGMQAENTRQVASSLSELYRLTGNTEQQLRFDLERRPDGAAPITLL